MTKDNGGPAFPSEVPSLIERSDLLGHNEGMTLRDYFAVHASEADITSYWPRHENPTAVEARYAFADAMLKERSK